jgi:hypothetical protein
MTYSAWWRYVGAEDWNEIQSSAPITWTQEIIRGQSAVPYIIRFRCRSIRNSTGLVEQTQYSSTHFNQFHLPIRGPISSLMVRTVISGSVSYRTQAFSGLDGLPRTFSANLFGSASRSIATIDYVCDEITVTRQDGLPDGFCRTTFSNGLVVDTPNGNTQCIDVTTTPPECPCCGEMLPVASSILTTLEGMI